MKSTKQLMKIFNESKNDTLFYDFNDFVRNSKSLIEDIKKENVYCSLKVSKSGMTRHFGFKINYNVILNIVYNKKISNDPVKIGGCGMDMGFHLLYSFCNAVMTEKEIEKYEINSKCGRYNVI